MTGYILHPDAFDDLDQIRAYIAEDNPDAANRVVTEIFRKIRGLVESPIKAIAAPTSHLALLFGLVREYVIAYAPDMKRCGFSLYFTAAATRV